GQVPRVEGGCDRGAARWRHLRFPEARHPRGLGGAGGGQPILDQVIQVTKGSKQKELAWKLVDMYLSPEVQTAFATELFFSPTNKPVKLRPEVARKMISGPAEVDKLVLFDWAKVARQRPQWTERWNKELR